MKIPFSPVTRISGLLSVDLFTGSSGTVIEANVIGEQFRGFEAMLRGRKVTDAVYFTQRVCGICSMAHGYTAARMVERIYGIEPPPEVILLQQAMLGAEYLQNYIRHFYLLALPDYLDATPIINFPAPGGPSPEKSRFTPAQQQFLMEHYLASMEASRKCHEMLAVFGGKIPHQHGLTGAGVTVFPDTERRIQFLSLLQQVQGFIQQIMLPDVYLLAEVYPDYLTIGSGPGTFLSYGLFDPRFGGHFPAGVWNGGQLLLVDPTKITENITFAWYEKKDAETSPAPEKPGAYTWVKAPRYQGLPCEGGPLARKIISGLHHGSALPSATGSNSGDATGVMARLLARVEEATLISGWILDWIKNLPQNGDYISPLEKPVLSQAFYANEAPRGPLLHSVSVSGETITSYDIITPSEWNFSPKDETGARGPAETALIGSKTEPGNPVEPGRIIRSFDPCLSCATHMISVERRA
ncbi:MAG TPA: nickel-dependent hydrogenase large subunit [Bacillota bacterium]|nr:nickel-dependent hydrogenase large subunit [Bacillota bacterium]